jgi:tetratricopeptide (TPR) repeat protein/transcriptional regulator with XRE-family HTH domain
MLGGRPAARVVVECGAGWSVKKGDGMGTPHSVGFGELLRRYRQAVGLTQQALAERAALGVETISALERGVNQHPRQETIARLARALALAPREERALAQAAQRRPAGAAGLSASTAPALLDSSLPPLAGRTEELGLLERHLAGDGSPLLLFTGEPGIGKSRLLGEAAAMGARQGVAVLAGGCRQRGGQEPYAPVVDALVRYLRSLAPAQARAQLRGCAWLVKLLPELAGGPIEPLPAWTVPPPQERRLSFAAVERFLANMGGPGGTVLLLDDLQWASPDALDLLRTLVAAAAETGLRLVAAYRDTEVPAGPLGLLLADLAPTGAVALRRLDPLAPPEADQLLSALLGEGWGGPRGAALREQVLRRTGGVPFFLVSCDQGLVPRAAGADGQGADPLPVPWSVAHSIRQRVAALPADARVLLGTAAVVGRTAPRAVLSAMSDQSPAQVLDALAAACRAWLLEEEGQDAYRFAHDVVREAILGDLGAARRAALHQRAAEVLEGLPGVRAAEVLAYHYTRSDVPQRALPYLEQAGDRARAQNAHEAAEGYYRELVERLDRWGRSLEAARVREKLGVLLTTAGRPAPALAVLEEAAQVYQTVGDQVSLGHVVALLADAHLLQGTPHDGLRRLLPVLALLEAAGAGRVLVELHLARARFLFYLGRYQEELAAAEHAVDLARTLGDDLLLGRAQRQHAGAQNMVRQGDAVPAFEEAIRLAEAAGDLRTLAEALNGLANVSLLTGAFDAASAYNERALDAATRLGDPLLAAHQINIGGYIAIHTGDWSQARRHIERGRAMREAFGPWAQRSDMLCVLGLLCLVEGAWDDAARHLEEAAALAARFSIPGHYVWAQRLLAELELCAGRPAAARARLLPLLDGRQEYEEDAAFMLPSLALASLHLGDTAAAATTASRAVGRARAERILIALPEALRVAALVAAEQERWDEAAAALAEGLALTKGFRYPYAEARLRATSGLLAMRKQAPEQAQECLEAALTIFRRLGARKDGQQTEQALATLQAAWPGNIRVPPAKQGRDVSVARRRSKATPRWDPQAGEP